MTHSSGNGALLVSRTADALAGLSSKAAPGDFLGSEADLLRSLEVSRPTLRQAAKIVESDRMIAVRRGSNGGFYAARPDAADVIRAPARYLRLQGATLADVHAVTKLIAEVVGAVAAVSDDGEMRDRIAEFRGRIDGNDSAGDLIRSETELGRLLAAMSGNPAAQLFMEIGYTFGRSERHLHFYQSAVDRHQARVLQRALCDAVLARDPEVARLMMQRRSKMIGDWLARERN